MTAPLPEYVEPVRLARAGTLIEGTLSIASLPRLTADVGQQEGLILVRLQFALDAKAYVCITGTVKVGLALTCNRCLQRMQMPVRAKVRLGIIGSEGQSSDLPPSYEPLVLSDDTVSLIELVEDELILAMPIVPAHAPGQCRSAPNTAADEEPNEHPFAVLASLNEK